MDEKTMKLSRKKRASANDPLKLERATKNQTNKKKNMRHESAYLH